MRFVNRQCIIVRAAGAGIAKRDVGIGAEGQRLAPSMKTIVIAPRLRQRGDDQIQTALVGDLIGLGLRLGGPWYRRA